MSSQILLSCKEWDCEQSELVWLLLLLLLAAKLTEKEKGVFCHVKVTSHHTSNQTFMQKGVSFVRQYR